MPLEQATLNIACSKREGGGWAFYLSEARGRVAEGAGRDPEATSLLLELEALLAGLAGLGENPFQLTIRTLDQNVAQTFRDWVPSWRAQGWPQKIQSLGPIRAVAELLLPHEVEWQVIERASTPGDLRARQLAQLAATRPSPRPSAVEAEKTDKQEPDLSTPVEASGRLVGWTDGGCRGNPGPGAWAFLLLDRSTGRCLERWGGERHTTNNRMELSAAIELLKSLKGHQSVEIRTDSRFLIDVCTKWIKGWKRKGWRKADGLMIKNPELVQELDTLIVEHEIRWTWVRGHQGEPGNEHVDQVLNAAMDALGRSEPAQGERRRDEPPLRALQQLVTSERSSTPSSSRSRE